MGHRATYAYNNGSTTTMTTVQSSSRLNENLPKILEHIAEAHECSKAEAAERLFSNIARYTHVGSVEFLPVAEFLEYFNKRDDYMSIRILASNENGVSLIKGTTVEEEFVEKVDANEDMFELVSNHYHAQDGYSAWFVKGGDKVSYWIDGEYNRFENAGEVVEISL